MATSDDMSEMAQRILRRLMERDGVRQAFVFNSEGDPFWAGRRPITADENRLLDAAVTLLAEGEKTLTKPFVAHDEQHRFSAAALEEDADLYLVLLHGPTAVEARMAAVRREAAELLHEVRNPALRLAWAGSSGAT